jgi:hypothetical protein
MPADIDPLDPDSTHNPTVFQPRTLPDRTLASGPAQPARTQAMKRPATRSATEALRVLHFAHGGRDPPP